MQAGTGRSIAFHPLTFVGLAVLVYAAAVAVASTLPGLDRAAVVAAALTLDLAVVVPAAYWLLLVRGRGWPRFSVVPVFLASLFAASLVLPEGHHGTLGLLEWVAVPAELALVAFLLSRALRATRGLRGGESQGDPFDRLRASAREVLEAPVVAELLAYEVGLLYYALFSWRGRPHTGGARLVVTHHRRVGYGALAAGLMVVVAAETVPVHLLLSLWSPVAAWVLTGLSLYTILWLLGDWRAIVLRPSRVVGERLEVRIGVRWNLSLSLASVTAVRRVGAEPPPAGPGYLCAVAFGQPRLLLELAEPVTARGPYGWKKEVRRLGLTVDDEAAFLELFG